MTTHLFRFSNLLVCLTLFSMTLSCKKDKETKEEERQEEERQEETINHPIVGKWNISAAESPYSSIEFSRSGDYIIVSKEGAGGGKLQTGNSSNNLLGKKRTASGNARTNSSPIHFGSYKIDGNKITLTGFGVIDVINLTEEEFHFSFTIQSTGNANEYIASKTQEPIMSSSRADMICKTWVLDKVTIDVNSFDADEIAEFIEEDGPNWAAIWAQEETEDSKGDIVLFSKAGTYLILYKNQEIKDEAGLAEWKWTNSSENAFYYSWDNWTSPDWTDDVAKINELTNSKLVINDDGLVYHLVLR